MHYTRGSNAPSAQVSVQRQNPEPTALNSLTPTPAICDYETKEQTTSAQQQKYRIFLVTTNNCLQRMQLILQVATLHLRTKPIRKLQSWTSTERWTYCSYNSYRSRMHMRIC